MDELIPLSALQHYSYCPRQCALIHQEQTFTENVFTIRGRHVHERVDKPDTRIEQGVQIQTAVPLIHERLGLIGKADAVERRMDGTLCPVEYKHGPRRQKQHDDIQVAAQAMCLEEMTNQRIDEGVIYHHASHRRRIVPITRDLRNEVEKMATAVHALFRAAVMPPPASNTDLCSGCSLVEACQPDLVKANHQLLELSQHLYLVVEGLP